MNRTNNERAEIKPSYIKQLINNKIKKEYINSIDKLDISIFNNKCNE